MSKEIKITKIIFGTRSGVFVVTLHDILFKRLWERLVERLWKGSEMSQKVELESCRLFCMRGSDQKPEDRKAVENSSSKEHTQEISNGKKDCIHCCGVYISLCPEILTETKIKDDRIKNLAKEMSWQSNVEVATLILLWNFIQTFVENQEQRYQKHYLKCEFGRKKT